MLYSAIPSCTRRGLQSGHEGDADLRGPRPYQRGIGRVRYGREEVILTHYGSPAAVVISFEEYQRLKRGAEEVPEYQLPPEIDVQIEETRRHPERRTAYRRRTAPQPGA